MSRDVYVVEVAYDDEDPGTFGPYTQAQAERVAGRIMAEVAIAVDELGGNHHPHGVRFAASVPLRRYDDASNFLDSDARRAVRRAVRAADKAIARRRRDAD